MVAGECFLQKNYFVKITIFRRKFLFGYCYKRNCNGDKGVVKATKMIVISTDTVVVCIETKRDCSQIFVTVTNSFFCVLTER